MENDTSSPGPNVCGHNRCPGYAFASSLNYVRPPEVHFAPHLRPAAGLVLAAVVLLLAAGCSTYDGKPAALGAAAVDAALTASTVAKDFPRTKSP